MTLIEKSLSAILAGICISLGGWAYLTVGGPFGACLFSIGLLTVLHFHALLYTGVVRRTFRMTRSELPDLLLIIAGNVVGCFLASFIFRTPAVVDAAANIIQIRAAAPLGEALCRAIGCGFIMTVAVSSVRQEVNGGPANYWPLLIGIPAFILTGMYHSIADMYYWCLSGLFSADILLCWLTVVVGNFIGGVAAPLLRLNKEY